MAVAGITALGTTYDLPNYTGELFALTPADTPFLSAIGGLSAGRQTTSTEFEWQTYDLAIAGQNVALEGADAPALEGRTRANVTNVVQIHHRAVGVSYTKLGAFGQKAGTNNAEPNPVVDESTWQVQQALKEMARDVDFSFIQGVYQRPSDNSTPRKTRGLLAAISTNKIAKETATSTGLSASTDTISETTTARANGDKIVFTSVGASTTLVQGRVYFVVNKATDSFKVALAAGGSAVTIGTATVSYRVPQTADLSVDDVSALLQSVYDNGGITEQATAALVLNSSQKLAVSKAYASAYGKFHETSRNVGGVNVTTIETDFGVLNVMLERFMPQDTIAAVSLEQCAPVFLEIPGKGHMFQEPLAKTGAQEKTQIYGEVGLAYGSERSHGAITGLKV
ncbi:MAG TPA: DUF5309 family protein [Mycobacteriales bacterium]